MTPTRTILAFMAHTVLVAAFLTIFVWLAGYGLFVATVSTMKPQDTDQKTDAVIVLTGGNSRINTGLDLYFGGLADNILITGVNPQVKTRDLILLWLEEKSGTDRTYDESRMCCITLDYLAGSTEGNAVETNKWIRDRGFKSLRLVTAGYHMPRSILEFRYAMPDIQIVKHPVKPGDFKPFQKNFLILTWDEYNKTLLVWIKIHLRMFGLMPEGLSA